MICRTCKHWAGDREADANGQCRRYPPQAGGVVMVQGLQGPQPVILWNVPDTAPNFFCGEWAPREPQALSS